MMEICLSDCVNYRCDRYKKDKFYTHDSIEADFSKKCPTYLPEGRVHEGEVPYLSFLMRERGMSLDNAIAMILWEHKNWRPEVKEGKNEEG